MTYTLITGASSGIGYELAKVFAKQNHNLILVARNKQKLEELKNEIEKNSEVVAVVISIDLSEAISSQKLFDEILKRNLHVDILVNNAGLGDHGPFVDSEMTRIDEMINVNVTALTKLTRLFLPEMVRNKYGKILNVASTAAFQPGPLMSVYYATKAFVLSFSEALHEELSGSGVTVTALCPGPTTSGFQATAKISDVPLLDSMPVPSSAEVAEFGYKALFNEDVVAVHGLVNNVLAKSTSFVPRFITRKVIKKLQSKRTNSPS